jgi:hypothetical protein
MKHVLPVACCIALLQAAFVAAAAAPSGDGSPMLRKLDEVYVAPNAQLASYRAVMFDSPTISFDKGWRKNINSTRQPSRWVTASDAQKIVDDLSAGLAVTFNDVFKAKGYEIATSPAPGVLRIAPTVVDLYINAPDTHAPNDRRVVAGESAGDARLVLEARDSMSGAVVARIVDRADAHQLNRTFNPTTDVGNTFWMNALFRQWATYSANELQAGRDKMSSAQPR